jgi:hypothetical protein
VPWFPSFLGSGSGVPGFGIRTENRRTLGETSPWTATPPAFFSSGSKTQLQPAGLKKKRVRRTEGSWGALVPVVPGFWFWCSRFRDQNREPENLGETSRWTATPLAFFSGGSKNPAYNRRVSKRRECEQERVPGVPWFPSFLGSGSGVPGFEIRTENRRTLRTRTQERWNAGTRRTSLRSYGDPGERPIRRSRDVNRGSSRTGSNSTAAAIRTSEPSRSSKARSSQ